MYIDVRCILRNRDVIVKAYSTLLQLILTDYISRHIFSNDKY